MWLQRSRYWLPGPEAENDPGFREVVLRLGQIGLLVLGGVEALMTSIMEGVILLLEPSEELLTLRLQMAGSLILLGVLTMLASRIPSLRQRARMLGIVSAVLTGSLLTFFFIRMAPMEPGSGYFIPCNMTLILLVAVVSLPLRPLQTLGMGALLAASYLAMALPDAQMTWVVFMLLLSFLAAALSAILYQQRGAAWKAHREAVRASENLRQAEARNLLAQNAASVGRLAAALSHELNSPVGALVSGVDTLLLLSSRQAAEAGATPQQQRMLLLQNDLRKTIRASTDRLKEMVRRMQRFTNLDQAEVQPANLNELLSDVALLLESTWKQKAVVDLELGTLPALTCRPQQLSAVFSSLLGNAVEAASGGGSEGRVRVLTSADQTHIRVAIEDNGQGLTEEEISGIFDPGFKVSGGRVASGNWSMFSSRQIINEHGGDITLTSCPGKGTCVSVLLPVAR